MTHLNSGHYSSPAKASPVLTRLKQCQGTPWHWSSSCATPFLYQRADGVHTARAVCPPPAVSPPWGHTWPVPHEGRSRHLISANLPAANLKSSSVLQYACSLLLQRQSSAPLRCCPVTHPGEASAGLHLLFSCPESETTQLSCYKASPMPSPSFQHVVSKFSMQFTFPTMLSFTFL